MGLRTLTKSNCCAATKKRPTAQWIAEISMVALLCLCLPPPVFANDQSSAPVVEREHREINSFRIKIRRLQEGILEKEDQIHQTQSEEQNILYELEILDKKLIDHQDKLADLLGKMEKQQELIAREENALAKIREEKGIVENHLKKRIAAYYTMGDIGLLNVTFSTQTLPELLTFHDAFDVLIKYDQDVIRVFRDTIHEIERKKTALSLEKTVLQDFITQTANEKQILEATKADKRLLLTQVRTQTTLHKKAKEEMQQASNALSKSIVSLKSKIPEGDDGFVSDKGNLPPPIDGRLVTLFRQKKVNKLGIERISQGIELQGPDNTPVIAVSSGEVIFSGYLRGYGNTVIIHHGQRYYTVTSRLEKLQVKAGQRIKREETIGLVGTTATLFEDGIYFEIRNNTEVIDPLLWLNPNRLKATHELSGDTAQKEQIAP
jgi:septal ring factor EnvC (AmiA/AmiB activator)